LEHRARRNEVKVFAEQAPVLKAANGSVAVEYRKIHVALEHHLAEREAKIIEYMQYDTWMALSHLGQQRRGKQRCRTERSKADLYVSNEILFTLQDRTASLVKLPLDLPRISIETFASFRGGYSAGTANQKLALEFRLEACDLLAERWLRNP
jgi:hypothetical protein